MRKLFLRFPTSEFISAMWISLQVEILLRSLYCRTSMFSTFINHKKVYVFNVLNNVGMKRLSVQEETVED